LAGCGGGGSDPVPTTPVDIGDNEIPDDDEDEFDNIVDGPAPEPTLINITTARGIAIESLELADSLVYFFSDASSVLLNAVASPISCGASGSVTVTQGPTERSFDLDNCAIGGDAGLVLDGVASFDGSFGNRFTGTQTFTTLAVTSGTRTATINGTASVSSTPGNIAVTNGALVLNDSQSEVTLSQASIDIRNAGAAQQSVEMNMTADAPRFGLVGATLVSTGLNSQRVACPQSGNLTVSATGADGSVVINGTPGENLTYVVDGTTETLACSEVATILQPSVEVILTPPPAPGSL